MARASSTRPLIALGLVVVVVAAILWIRQASRRATVNLELRGANVLLITIDTLRLDRIGAYGSRAGLTPTLDALALGAVYFTRVWSHAPITLPAHASILTGLVPPRHGVRNNGSFRLGSGPTTLAERLRLAGYRTGAFVGAFVLDARFGLDRGFEEYDDRYRASARPASFHFVERPADQVLRAATAWITEPKAGDRRPWFAWVHLFDPHAPYQAPIAHASGRAPYDAEVAWTDAAIGSALDSLRQAGHLNRTLVVVTADHGESLGDHGETTHGLFAYDATLRVPLIVSAPGLEPRSIATPAAHVDIMPTILDLVAVESPDGFDGRSLVAAIDGSDDDAAPSPLYFEALDATLTRGWAPLTGLVDGTWKYIDLPLPELYQLDADPGEQTNVAKQETARVRQMRERLAQWVKAPSASGGEVIDSVTAARLQSLGYVATSARPQATYSVEDDPKYLVSLSETFNDALDDYGRGRKDEAVEKFSRVLRERPDFLAARLSAATVMIGSGRAVEAIPLLRSAPESDRSSVAWQTRLGQALAAVGDLAEARAMLEAAVKRSSGDAEPLNELGVVLMRLGRPDEARRAFEQLLAADATAAGTWYNLGLLELGVKRPTQAATAFARVVELDPNHVDGWRALGAAASGDDPARAIEAWKRVLELDRHDFDTLYNLGMVLADTGRGREAAPYLRRFLAEAPRERYARDLARVRAVLARVDRPS